MLQNENNVIAQTARKAAKNAFEHAKKRKHDLKNEFEEYTSYVKKIPMMIQTNGMAAAFAFMFSKSGTYKNILEDIAAHLDDSSRVLNGINGNVQTLISKTTTLESALYRAATNEVMVYLGWLKRYAAGLEK